MPCDTVSAEVDWPSTSWNHGQTCCAGTRIFVQAGIYDKFLAKFTEKTKSIKVGDPFHEGIDQGPQVSQLQFDVSSFPFRLPQRV